MLELVVEGTQHHLPLAVGPSTDEYAEFVRRKEKKLARIEELLRCPMPAPSGGRACGGRLERDGPDQLQCRECARTFSAGTRGFDFLTSDLRDLAGIEDSENVSSWGYDPWAQEMIESCDGGLVLDVGAGFKGTYHDDVVNFEIADYPTTDVLGVGERLPFADASFDAVLSLVVLEHVRDPFRCAAEIVRVLKPGGRLYASAPFLQPYHGYPHHYYNMTQRGLERLFADDVEIEQSGVPRYGLPIYALTWFLNSYVAGLPPDVAARFRLMRVADLLAPADSYLDEDIVASLPGETNVELACVNYLMGRKRA
jgi:SAM-dependent methyltransferase